VGVDALELLMEHVVWFCQRLESTESSTSQVGLEAVLDEYVTTLSKALDTQVRTTLRDDCIACFQEPVVNQHTCSTSLSNL
jgi:hypothetical protein